MSARPELVDADELAARLGPGIGRRWVYRAVEAGMPAFKIGRRLLFNPEAAWAWIEQHRVGEWNVTLTNNGVASDS